MHSYYIFASEFVKNVPGVAASGILGQAKGLARNVGFKGIP